MEIAELFLRSTEGLVADVYDHFGFGSGQYTDPRFGDVLQYEFYIVLEWSGEQSKANLRYWDRENADRSNVPSADVLPRHSSYYWLMRLAFALGRDLDTQPLIRHLISSSGARIQARTVKVIGIR